MTIYTFSQTDPVVNFDLDQISIDVKKQQTDDLIKQLAKKIEDLEKLVLSSENLKAKNNFSDLTALAEKVIPCAVKITADYNFYTLYAQEQAEVPFSGHGSGAVISSDGYILTNFHVIDGAGSVRVYNNYTDQYYDAEICQVDPNLDLALIKIDEEDLPFLNFGNSDLMRPGDFVVLTGNPFGFKNLLTLGVVGNVAQGLFEAYEYGWQKGDVGRFSDYLISDAMSNPGNSGGPLVNLNGQLVGIASRGSEGLGLSITSNTAMQFLSSISENKGLLKNVFAAELSEITLSECQYFDLPDHVTFGAIVLNLENNGFLSRNGLLNGDVLVGYNDTDFVSLDRFYYDLARILDVGQDIDLEIIRNHEKIHIIIPLQVENVYQLSYLEKLGIKAQMLESSLAIDLDLDVNVSGVVICEVEAFSNAALSGLIPGDVILGVIDSDFNRIPVKTVDDLKDQLELLEDKKKIYLQIASKYFNKTMIISVDLD